MEIICNNGKDDCVVDKAPKLPPGFVKTEMYSIITYTDGRTRVEIIPFKRCE